MNEIKAIETRYNGYRFRSRLEARWAVFFDAVKLPYEYEKDGFNLGKYGWYLPDFYFPTIGTFCEIKPQRIIDPKSQNFRNTNQSILLVFGYPWDYTAEWHGFDTCDSGGGFYESEATIGNVPINGKCIAGIIVNETREDRTLFKSEWDVVDNIYKSSDKKISNPNFPKDWIWAYGYMRYTSSKAIEKSQIARFEHGETPVGPKE